VSIDIKFALRSLRREWKLGLAVLSVVAIGIGPFSVVFACLRAVVLKPLPFPDASSLVTVWLSDTGRGYGRLALSALDYQDLVNKNSAFQASAVVRFETLSASATVSAEPERLQAARVSQDFFALFGRSAQIGRFFNESDFADARTDLVVLSDLVWRQRFGGDQGVIGRIFRANGIPFTIIGVAPSEFPAPDWAQVWLPLQLSEKDKTSRQRRDLQVFARLTQSVTIASAQQATEVLSEHLQAEQSDSFSGIGVTLIPLSTLLVGDRTETLWSLFVGALLVTMITAVNLATLGVLWSTRRRREFTIREAIGAAGWHLWRPHLIEGALLMFFGAVVGLLIGYALLAAALGSGLNLLPHRTTISVAVPMALIGLAMAAGAWALFGIIPLSVRHRTTQRDTLLGTGDLFAPKKVSYLRGAIVVLQLSLSVPLTAAAVWNSERLVELLLVDPGFDPTDLLTVRVHLPSHRYQNPASAETLYREVLGRTASLPSVLGVAGVAMLPLSGASGGTQLTVQEHRSEPLVVGLNHVTPSFFRTMDIAVKAGAFFAANAERQVVVNETLAQLAWPNADPLGKGVLFPGQRENPSIVVGVVEDIRTLNLAQPPRPEVYVPYLQGAWGALTLILRSRDAPLQLADEVRSIVWSEDRDVVVTDVRSMRDVVWGSLGDTRILSYLLLAFAFTTVLLSLVAVYGNIRSSVERERPSIAIRVALGANRRSVFLSYLKQGATIGVLGVLGGVFLSVSLDRVLAHLVPGLDEVRLPTVALAAILLLTLTVLSSLLPSLYSSRFDIAAELRYK
jgi:predicted permease